jgi:hypothetical protein
MESTTGLGFYTKREIETQKRKDISKKYKKKEPGLRQPGHIPICVLFKRGIGNRDYLRLPGG